MTTNSIGLTIPIPAAQGGTGTVGTGILDTNGNEVITYPATASAVNHVEFINAATGVNPQVLARGDDTNIILQLGGKGTGGVAIVGTSTNDDAGATYVGQMISSTVLFASGVSLTNATNANVTSILLTAGDWDVWANANMRNTGGGTSNAFAWISDVSVTVPDQAYYTTMTQGTNVYTAMGLIAPSRRYLLSSATTIYLTVQNGFNAGTVVASGGIYARRRR